MPMTPGTPITFRHLTEEPDVLAHVLRDVAARAPDGFAQAVADELVAVADDAVAIFLRRLTTAVETRFS